MPQPDIISYQIHSESQLLELAHSLGRPVPSRRDGPLISRLIPLPKEQAHPQSLSANFGEEAFPYHTDGAYFPVPPHYIVMRYVKGPEHPTPTQLCQIDEVEGKIKDKLQFHLWKVSSTTPFYAPILSEDDRYFRFDPCIMTPVSVNQNNQDQIKELIGQHAVTNIDWQLNQTVVIDNWRTFHKRPAVRLEEINYRTIERIMIL